MTIVDVAIVIVANVVVDEVLTFLVNANPSSALTSYPLHQRLLSYSLFILIKLMHQIEIEGYPWYCSNHHRAFLARQQGPW
jgi:hypothetical protein